MMRVGVSTLVLAAIVAACSDGGSLGDAGVQDARVEDATPAPDAAPDARANEDAEPPDTAFPDAAAPDAFDPDAEPEPDAGEDLRAFQTPELVERGGSESADSPALGVAANGDVIVAWVQKDSDTMSPTDVWATRAQGGATFPNGAIIDGLRESPGTPVMAIAPDGHAIVAWRHATATAQFVWTNRFTPNVGWEGPLPIYGVYSTPGRIRVAIDEMGRATVVWTDEAENNRVWVSRFENGAWVDATRLDDGPMIVRDVDLAGGPGGEVLAGWSKTATVAGSSTVETNIVVRRYNPVSMIWSPEEIIEMMAPAARSPHFAFDAAGASFAVWGQDERVYASYAPAGGSWEVPVAIAHDGVVDPATIVLGMGEGGQAIAAWTSTGAAMGNGMYGARARANGVWVVPEELLEPEPAIPTQAALDPLGQGLLVWTNPGVAVSAKRLFGGTWKPSVLLTGGGERPSSVQVGLDRNGNGVAVWAEYPELQILSSIWFARFAN